MVILDTSVIIDHLRQSGKNTHLLRLEEKFSKENLAISIISIQELYEGKSLDNKDKEDALLYIISPLKILPYTFNVAELAGEIARNLPRPAEFADAAIAATAITNGCQLFTLDKKDFSGIAHLEVLKEI